MKVSHLQKILKYRSLNWKVNYALVINFLIDPNYSNPGLNTYEFSTKANCVTAGDQIVKWYDDDADPDTKQVTHHVQYICVAK